MRGEPVRERWPSKSGNHSRRVDVRWWGRWGVDRAMPSGIDDEERWRSLAAEARALAGEMSDPRRPSNYAEYCRGI